jgi:hypothetical protein
LFFEGWHAFYEADAATAAGNREGKQEGERAFNENARGVGAQDKTVNREELAVVACAFSPSLLANLRALSLSLNAAAIVAAVMSRWMNQSESAVRRRCEFSASLSPTMASIKKPDFPIPIIVREENTFFRLVSVSA